MAQMNQAMSDLVRYNAALQPQHRSRFNKSHSHTTTFDSAYLIPIMWDRVVPGDEKQIDVSALCRMATPIHPVMDEAKLDIWAFYCPDRLWYSDAKAFYGENLDADFNPDGEYEMPSLTVSQYRVVDRDTDHDNGVGSLNDYFGFPVIDDEVMDRILENHRDEFKVTAGLHRCYQLIWNEWFRNSAIQPALQLNTGPTVDDNELRVIRKLRKVNRYPDYFTTCLKQPQAGEDVLLPISEWAPVVTRGPSDLVPSDYFPTTALDRRFPVKILDGTGSVSTLAAGRILALSAENLAVGERSVETDSSNNLNFGNLWTRFTSTEIGSINALRSAITVQQFLEVDNIAGRRYQSILQSHFGVLTPDATLQRPELLGASRTSIGMRQVIQTSETSGESPLGNTGAVSLTNVNNSMICNKAFTEPGFIMVLAAVRTTNTYSQGLNCLLTKIHKFDHYWQEFDNIGNQPVYNYELFMNSPDPTLGNTFGYKEAWLEYRLMNNRVSGLMRPDVNQNLASWNYSLDFNGGLPLLNDEFISADPYLIDRVIAVPSQPQFILDTYFQYFDTKSMSVHSTPGLTKL